MSGLRQRCKQFWRARLHGFTSALPIDLYRVLMGLLALLYFLRILAEFQEFTAYQGFLDHALILRIFWFAGGVSLFQPGFPEGWFFLCLLVGAVACLGIIAGYRPRLCALVALVVAVSSFRWNFPVINLDDAAVQLGLTWIILLPVGRTLILWEAWRDPAGSLRRWSLVQVSSGEMWLYFANLAVAYLVTGLTKYASSLWRDGYALFVVLRLPLASTSQVWTLDDLAWTSIFNHLTLIVEPLLPLVVLLPTGHPLKWLGLACALGLHLGIICTIGIPFANFGMLIGYVLVFREELMGLVYRLWARQSAPERPAPRPRLTGATRVAIVMVSIIALSMSEGVPLLGNAYVAGFVLQWSLGMAQEYHLFDWVDKFNYVVRLRVELAHPDGTVESIDPAWVFPRKVRGFLLQSYLFNMRWMRVPKGQMGELQRSLRIRAAAMFARRHPGHGVVTVIANVQRGTADNLALDKGEDRVLMQFSLDGDQARLIEVPPSQE